MRSHYRCALSLGAAIAACYAVPPAHAQTTQPDQLPPGVVATVNGIPIREDAVEDRMWREQGPLFTDYAVRSRIVRQEAARRGISVTPQELQDRMVEYQAQFSAVPGRQPRDWELFVKRFGMDYIESRQLDEMLATKIGDAEAARTALTDEEKARVRGDLERAAHKVHVRHAFIGHGPEYGGRTEAAARARAGQAREKLRSGAKWEDVVAEYSDDISTRLNGGDLGLITRDQVVTPLEEAAFAATPGDEIHLIPVPNGFDVFQVLDRQDNPPTEEQIQSALNETLERKKKIARSNAAWFPTVEREYTVVTRMPYESGPRKTTATAPPASR